MGWVSEIEEYISKLFHEMADVVGWGFSFHWEIVVFEQLLNLPVSEKQLKLFRIIVYLLRLELLEVVNLLAGVLGDKWGLHLLLTHRGPVDRAEPGVLLEF